MATIATSAIMNNELKCQFCGEQVNITTEHVQTNSPKNGDFELWLLCHTCHDENLPCETFFELPENERSRD